MGNRLPFPNYDRAGVLVIGNGRGVRSWRAANGTDTDLRASTEIIKFLHANAVRSRSERLGRRRNGDGKLKRLLVFTWAPLHGTHTDHVPVKDE